MSVPVSVHRVARLLAAGCAGLCLFVPHTVAQAPTTVRVSVATDGTQGNLQSSPTGISLDGRYVVFVSASSNLVKGDTNGCEDVFIRDTVAGSTARVSVGSGSTQGNNSSVGGSISADGRYVAFCSNASNLVPGDTNCNADVFIRDTLEGTTMLASVASDGTPANSSSNSPAISADGRYVAFFSNASNLVPYGTSSGGVFVRDTLTGTTKTVTATGFSPSIRADGRYVAFVSNASNLVPDDTNGLSDVFVRDMVAGTTKRISVASNGAQQNYDSNSPSISADGRYVAYCSFDHFYDPNGTHDVFVRDTLAGTTTLVSGSFNGSPLDNTCGVPSISADGRYIAFHSNATNLVPDDTNKSLDVFVRDMVMGTTARISVADNGTQGNRDSSNVSISANGWYVAFYSDSSNLVPGDTNGSGDVFVRTLFAGATFLQQPTISVVEVPFAPPVRVGCGRPVTLTIKAGTGSAGAVLTGTTTVSPIDGTATFTNLAIDKPGTGYVLVASSGPLDRAESLPFDVSPMPAHVLITTQPDLAEAGKPFQQQPVALARDAINVLIADYNAPVTLAIKAGTGAPGAALIGTTTVIAVNGVATFTDLGVDRKGTGYVLEVFVGTNKLGESAAFDVAPAAQRLVFIVQPGGATDDWPFTSQPVVKVVDADGDTAALNKSPITLAIKAGTGTPGALLSGTSGITALHGVAGFAGLIINKVGTGYVLTASSPALAPADSAAFDAIEAPKLVLRQSAADEIEVSVHPAGANIIGTTVALSWNAAQLAPVSPLDMHPAAGWNSDTTDTTSGLTVTLSNAGTNVNGPVLTLQLSAEPGFTGHSATVSLTDVCDLTDDGYNTLPVLPRSTQFIPGGHISFTRQPVSTTLGDPIAGQPTVAMLDGTGTAVSDFTDPVTMAIKPGMGTPGAVLGGTTFVNATAGVAAFNGLTIDRKGIGYVLLASSGPFSTESLAFDIAPKALKLAFTTQPGSARAGLPAAPQPVVAVQDDDGATAFAFSGPISLAIKSGTGFPGATLAGTATLNAVSGVAAFNDVRIGTAAPGYVLTASGQPLTGAESAAFDVTPFAFTTADVRDAIRWAAGLSPVPAGYVGRFDVVPNGAVDLRDAVRIARKAVGLEANP